MPTNAERLAEVLAWFDEKSSEVSAHPGAAYPEVKVLEMLAGGVQSSPAGILGDAYAADAARGVREMPNRNDVYPFTHMIMFATNFGRQALTGIDQSAYEAAIESLCATYIDDTDLLGELLFCAKCIGFWSSALDAAMAEFVAQWDALDRDNFAGSYHQLVVGGLLFSKG